MNIQQLESFLQVAENLNFARAADCLNITQSSVSRQIRALEEELDTKLFDRTTRTVVLTSDGIIFLEHAKQILSQLKIATAKIQHHTNAHMQTLTIGCESETDLEFLQDHLRTCRQQIMSFRPVLKIIPHRSLWNLFFQREIELLFGFQENLPIRQDLVFVELGKIPLCCALPVGHPLARRREVDAWELFSEYLILCDSYTIPAKAEEIQHLIAQHISPEKIQVSEHPQAVLALIRAGYGCSILPQRAGAGEEIVYVPLHQIPPLPYGMVYDPKSTNPVLKRFLEVTGQPVGQ